jgi:hypothetical protein
VCCSAYVSTYIGNTANTGLLVGYGTSAEISGVVGVSVDSLGHMYLTDYSHQVVRFVNSSGKLYLSLFVSSMLIMVIFFVGYVSLVAGAPSFSGIADGTGTNARLNGPGAITVDTSLNVYFTEAGSNSVRKLVMSSSQGMFFSACLDAICLNTTHVAVTATVTTISTSMDVKPHGIAVHNNLIYLTASAVDIYQIYSLTTSGGCLVV